MQNSELKIGYVIFIFKNLIAANKICLKHI